ncbi:MAG: rhodanese-like domain-containing protein [Enterococcus sp.]
MTHSITAQDFQEAMKQPNALVIDIRNTTDFTKNHVTKALSLPVTSIPNHIHQLDTNKTYYIVSYSGRRSETIASYLQENGFHAVHVIGGMHALNELAA